MSTETDAKSGKSGSAESGTTETTTEITVDRTPEEYAARLREVSAENKKFRERYHAEQKQREELQKQIDALTESQQKEKGQYKEMYEQLKSKYDSEAEARKKDQAAYAFATVTSQMAAEASKLGCQNVDALIKLATADGIISELEVSKENFQVAPDSLKAGLEKAQKQYAFLFAKPTPGMRDGVPSTKQTAATKPDLTNMKMEELVALAKNLPQ